MNLLRYEFAEGPDGSINGMLRHLVKGPRYNRSYVTAEEFRKALPEFYAIESNIQRLDADISRPKRNCIQEIMGELDREQDDEGNIVEDLRHASIALIKAMLNQDLDFEELSFSTARADHYHWLQFGGYTDKRPADSNLLIVREVFRAVCNKYEYILIDLS